MSKALKQLLAGAYADQVKGSVFARKPQVMPKGRAVYLVSSAQNNTAIHEGVWQNIKAYAKYRGAEILVARFTYNKSVYEAMGGRRGKDDTKADASGLWYAPEITPHLCDENVMLTRTLMFAGELNIIPTASDPLSGFDNFGNRASLIVPHVRQEMRSIASTHAAKLMYSTGAVTVRNYLQRKAGQLAEHYHAYGFLCVEVDADGHWFVRQVRCLENGECQDLDVRVSKGNVYTGRSAEALQPGDLHVAQIAPECNAALFGTGGMVDTLRPSYLFAEDLYDALAENHHSRGNPHAQFARHVRGQRSVGAELDLTAMFLKRVRRNDMRIVVVESNHDLALGRWIRETDLRTLDPLNAITWLTLQTEAYRAIAARAKPALLAAAMRERGVDPAVIFLRDGESFVICREQGGIEQGLHGHAGANGSRGSPRQFARLGRRVSTGHTHSASIIGDCFTAGTSTRLKLEYVTGPSSWSWSHILTYPNGCRTIVTQVGKRWRGSDK